MFEDGGNCVLCQVWIYYQSYVGGDQIFGNCVVECVRQVLVIKFFWYGKVELIVLVILVKGFFEVFWCFYIGVIVVNVFFLVVGQIDWEYDFFSYFGSFGSDCFQKVSIDIGKIGYIGVVFDVEDIVEYEKGVLYGGFEYGYGSFFVFYWFLLLFLYKILMFV